LRHCTGNCLERLRKTIRPIFISRIENGFSEYKADVPALKDRRTEYALLLEILLHSQFSELWNGGYVGEP
jgi:hypothetical protein